MPIESEMKSRLKSVMHLNHFSVKDYTGRHLNHKLHEGGFHLEVVIVSDDFEGKPLLKRHRMVYQAMGDLMKDEIHAFSMKTYTKIEWENI